MDVGPGPQGYPHSEIHWGPPWTQHIVVVTVKIGFSDGREDTELGKWGKTGVGSLEGTLPAPLCSPSRDGSRNSDSAAA